MVVKTFSRLYFFAFLIVYFIYIGSNDLSTRDRIEASIAVFIPFIFTLAIVSFRDLYFEKRRKRKDDLLNS